eukprot:scaffold23860_cov79-Cyclotella_meneghiniana.AAC.11
MDGNRVAIEDPMLNTEIVCFCIRSTGSSQQLDCSNVSLQVRDGNKVAIEDPMFNTEIVCFCISTSSSQQLD